MFLPIYTAQVSPLPSATVFAFLIYDTYVNLQWWNARINFLLIPLNWVMPFPALFAFVFVVFIQNIFYSIKILIQIGHLYLINLKEVLLVGNYRKYANVLQLSDYWVIKTVFNWNAIYDVHHGWHILPCYLRQIFFLHLNNHRLLITRV